MQYDMCIVGDQVCISTKPLTLEWQIRYFQLKMLRESRKKLKEEMDKLLVEIREIKTSASTLARLEVYNFST